MKTKTLLKRLACVAIISILAVAMTACSGETATDTVEPKVGTPPPHVADYPIPTVFKGTSVISCSEVYEMTNWYRTRFHPCVDRPNCDNEITLAFDESSGLLYAVKIACDPGDCLSQDEN